jgi:hypothetical protein
LSISLASTEEMKIRQTEKKERERNALLEKKPKEKKASGKKKKPNALWEDEYDLIFIQK